MIVAALSLKGKSALPNFPHLIHTLPRPASLDPTDMQYAAAQAALSFSQHSHPEADSALERPTHNYSATLINVGESMAAAAANDDEGGLKDSSRNLRIRTGREQYPTLLDEGLQQFDSPNLLTNMAEALLLTPPRLNDLGAKDYDYSADDCSDQPVGFGFLWSNI